MRFAKGWKGGQVGWEVMSVCGAGRRPEMVSVLEEALAGRDFAQR